MAKPNRKQRRTAAKQNPYEQVVLGRAQHSFEHIEIKPIEIVRTPDLNNYDGEAREAQDTALLHIRKGDFQAGIKAYEHIYSNNPEDVATANMLAALYVHQYEIKKAVKVLRKIIARDKDNFVAYNNLAAAYIRLMEYDKVEKPLIKALKLAPNTAEIHHNAGIYYQRQSRHSEAVQGYANAIKLKPLAESYAGLGFMRLNAPEKDGTIATFEKALQLDPNSDTAHFGLYYAYVDSDPEIALLHNAKAVNLRPDRVSYLAAFIELSRQLKTPVKSDEIASAILNILRYEKVPLRTFFRTWSRYLFLSSNFAETKRRIKEHDYEIDAQGYELLLPEISHEYFYRGLKNLIIISVSFEKLVTALREFILLNYRDNITINGDFLYGLAHNCFFNEFVFAESSAERDTLEDIEARIKNGSDVLEIEIVLYASYRPLFAEQIKDRALKLQEDFNSPLYDELIDIHISEREEEERLKKTIKTFGTIDNDISRKVKSMYEENPYPRWRYFIGLGEETLALYEKSRKAAKTKILVAGCGTGQQPIGVAFANKNAHITAIDISSASLAYAMRKTKESGYKNIKYYMGDLLEADRLGEMYDQIHCAGVLHHMEDPMAGWRLLTSLLKPGGKMIIGLYSEMARQSVVAARTYIAEQNLSPSSDNIKAMRDYISSLPKDHEMAPVRDGFDFFTTSSCRDLIFHVQEHRFTWLQIKDCLDELGLKFEGINEDEVRYVNAFEQKFGPDPALKKDIMKWHELEQDHPLLFFGMYQFLCSKP